MAKRNLWGFEETLAFISIIDEKECLQKIDDKILKPHEIHRVIEQEMFERGYYDKNAKQMEFRWKNLKKMYYKDKKMLESGVQDYKVSPYFEQLDEVLSYRSNPKVKRVKKESQIEDKVETETRSDFSACSSNEDEDLSNAGMPAFEECFPALPVPKPRALLKRRRSNEPESKIDMFHQKIKEVSKELNEDLFRKQKELIDYEFRLFSNYTTARDETFKEMIQTNTQTFLQGINDIFEKTKSSKRSAHILKAETSNSSTEGPDTTEVIQSCQEDDSNKI